MKKKPAPVLLVSVILGLVLVGGLWYIGEWQDAASTTDPSSSSEPIAGALGQNNAPKPETLTTYPLYPDEILRSRDYTVHLRQGGYAEEIAVYDSNTCVETWWGRSELPDRYRRFCEFAFTGEPVEVQIQPHFPIQSYRVLAASGEPKSSYNGQFITVSLSKPETFLLELNGDYNTLLTVFAEEPETDIPDKDDSKTMVIEGYYEPPGGYLRIDEPGSCIYLAPGAVLCARLSVEADNVTIRGRGVVLDPWSNLFAYDITQAPDNKLINIRGDHVTVEGIKLLDARNYNLWADFGVDDLKITGVKVLSAAATTDGLTLLGTTNSVIRNCFFYCGDNALVFEEQLSGTRILDCMIGTTCAAVFPQQDIRGDITLDGLYVFRADEGLVNNRYNNKDRDRTVETVTIRNVNAVNCRNLPWFFHGRFMGVRDKNFVFENIALPQIKSIMDTKLDLHGSLIRIDNYPRDRTTGGYRMDFTDLYVDGTAVEDLSMLWTKDERALNNVYTVSVTQPNSPVQPSAEINVEQRDEPRRSQPDAQQKLSRNLLEERNAPYGSIWCEGVSYLTDLTLSTADGTAVYKLAVAPNDYESGRMVTPLELTTEELQTSSGLSLRFDASAKTACEVTLRLTAATQEGTTRVEKSIHCTRGWNPYEAVWSKQELEALAETALGGIILEVIPKGSAYKELLFRSFDMKLNP